MKRKLDNLFKFIPAMALILGLMLAACGEATPTSRPTTAATTASAVTTAPATTPAATTAFSSIPTVTPGPTTTAPATTVVPTTAPAATLAPATTSAPANVNRLAYVDNGALYLIDTGSKEKVLLGEAKNGPYNKMSMSPAGNLLAVSIGDKAAVLKVINLQDRSDITVDKQGQTSDIDPEWSPDGKLVLFTRVYDSNKDSKFDYKDRHELWLVENGGANLRKLADGQMGAWATDGKRIVFVTDGKPSTEGDFPTDNAMRVINSEGKNEWEPISAKKIPNDWNSSGFPFGPGAEFIRYPIFVDSGKRIAFNTHGATGAIFSLNAFDGKDLKLWQGMPEGDFGRLFNAPGGTMIMIESYPPTGINEIDGINTAGNISPIDPPQLKVGGVRQNFQAQFPAWSPDGKRIAYVKSDTSSTVSGKPVKGTLVVATLKGDTLTDVTELTAGLFSQLTWGRY